MKKVTSNAAMTALLLSVLCLAAVVSTATAATLTATPDNSNILQISGTGFTANETVNVILYNGTTSVFSFPNCTADSAGSINATLIIPTSTTGGLYNITATGLTSNATASVLNFTVPNLMGATGATGAKGDKGDAGATGETGAQGVAGDMTVAFVALAVSLIAVAFAVVALIMRVPKH